MKNFKLKRKMTLPKAIKKQTLTYNFYLLILKCEVQSSPSTDHYSVDFFVLNQLSDL